MRGRKQSEVIFRQPEPKKPKPITESVIIPALIALISGMFVTAVLVFGVRELRGVWLDWSTVGLSWTVVSLVVWALSTWRDLLWFLEKATGQDIDKDGSVGRPGEERLILVRPRGSEQTPQESKQRKRASFEEFVRGCQFDNTLEKWEPILGRKRYDEFRDALIDTQWAQWVNPEWRRGGWILLEEPEEIIASLD